MPPKTAVILISASAEWRCVVSRHAESNIQLCPPGEWFQVILGETDCVFLHGGWGKIASAASTQYAIDQWRPELMINLGTCGGFSGRIDKGAIILADSTLVYDIVEQMVDPQAAVDHYAVTMDLNWLHEPYPLRVKRQQLLSADRDIVAGQIPDLISRYQASAADWESGAIAWVAAKNRVRCLILRGVSDLVDKNGGEAYGRQEVFEVGTRQVMDLLLDSLPGWLKCVE